MRTARMTAGRAASSAAAKMVSDRQREHGRASGVDVEEKRRDISRGGHSEGDSGDGAHQHHGEDAGGDATRDVAGLRADRHADADFAAALQHRVIEHAVEPDGGEQQRDAGEEEGQHGEQALADGVRFDDLRLRADVADAEFGTGARDFLPKDRGQRERVGARGADDERAAGGGLK